MHVVLCEYMLFIQCYVHGVSTDSVVEFAYVVLGIDGAMYLLDMWCCVPIVLCA